MEEGRHHVQNVSSGARLTLRICGATCCTCCQMASWLFRLSFPLLPRCY